MNKNIKLAVAGAVLALSATAANAGIIIPAGEWTVDISGNVNMYTSWSKTKGNNSINGGIVGGFNNNTVNNMGNGLLPNFLSVSGSTRQNDLDVSFTISLQPGSSNNAALQEVGSGAGAPGLGGLNNRQSFITFGDKSWGSVKVGKDLGIFASDAILSDITLLGVGGGYAGSAGNTSLGRIGSGYIYADWKPQIAYTTPNFSGFQATAGISQAFVSQANGSGAQWDNFDTANANVAYEGKGSYSFASNGVEGKVWVSGIAQHVGTPKSVTNSRNTDPMAYAGDIGAKVSAAGFDLVGYYYTGNGIGTTGQFLRGYGYNSNAGRFEGRDSNGGYIQAAYTLPTKTKVAVSWGGSYLDRADGEGSGYSGDSRDIVKSNEQWNLMLIQPLTKHLNLVAEYANVESENHRNQKNKSDTGSLGAILFF